MILAILKYRSFLFLEEEVLLTLELQMVTNIIPPGLL